MLSSNKSAHFIDILKQNLYEILTLKPAALQQTLVFLEYAYNMH